MHGIEKEIDRLGRLVIPIEFRKKLGLRAGDFALLFCNGGELTVRPKKSSCALCAQELCGNEGIRLCGRCIDRVKREF